MIECSSCGLMINKNDKKCPRCGHVFDVHKKEKDILTGVGATAAGAGVIAAGVVSHEKETKNTIKSIKNNTLKKSTEKIENTESVKKADSKTTTRTNNQNKKQTSSTAYENKKYNDSLELSESSNSTGNSTKESQNENEHDSSEDVKTEKLKETKSEDTKAQTNTMTSSENSTDDSYTQSESITQEELVNLLERLEEEQGNDENIKTILKEFSEKHKGDENLEELLKALMGNQGNFDDINEMNLEDEDELKSTADSSDMGGDGINISFYSLEQALAMLGEPSLAVGGGVKNVTSCPGYDKSGGLEKIFDKLESGNFTRIKEETSTFDNYRETIKGFFGENGSGGFVDNLRSSLVGLREKLKAMYTEAEYLEAYNSEMNYRFYDEYGHLDVEKALELYNSLHVDDRKSRWDLNTMSDEEYTSFYNYFSSDERVQNYFSNVEKNILNGVESIESKAFTSTDFYLRNKENGVILTEEEVKNHYKDFGDRIAAGLYTGLLGLGLIDLNSGYDGNKTYEDFINNRVTDGLTGYDTDADGNKTGEKKADYNGKSDAQKQLEILTYSWYAKDNSHYDSEQYKILTAYVDRYCEEKNIDKIDLPTNDHLYQLLQAGASNALWDEDGNFRTRTYFDEETGKMSEQEKIIQRYERAITGGYNENGELDNHRDSEWRINRTTFEESFILSNNYVRKSDALTEATKNHSELFKVDDETKEIIYDDDKKTSEYDENEKELYEIAKKASEEYKEALDAMNLFGFFVNQSQIDEAKKEAGENYSKDDYPAGVKEYLEYMNSDNKNPYQYMAKYDADNYSDAVEKFGDSMGSKVPHVIEIFSEMPSVKEGRITAEELAKNLSNSLSTNADYYHMYLESVEGQHITNVTGILSLAKTRAEDYHDLYLDEVQTANNLSYDNDNFSKSLEEKKIGAELAQEIGDSQARLSTISRDIETVQYNKIMAKLPSERTEEEKDFCMRYRIERTESEQKEFIAQLNDYYEKLSNCENINEATQLLNYISMINENKLCNLEQVFEGKKMRLNKDFEEASQSIIDSIKIENIVEGETVTTVIHKYDKDGNEINASQEETDLYYAKLAKENGGKLPFIYSSLLDSKDLERINYLLSNDIDLLTYKLHTEDSETFKTDYKNFLQYGALIQAKAEYQEYLDKLERRGDFGDWITTVGYGARAGFEQFADGIRSFMNPDGVKSSSEYRSMLISSYLLDTYGSDALNSNFMLGTYEISTSMANMLPSVALSMIPGVGQYLSLTAMFISSAGNSMEQAYQSGYTLEQSYIIGLISGALETGLQATVGGITKLKIKGRNPLGFLNVGDKLLSKMTEGTFRYALTNYGFNILSEGLEEGSQEFLGAFLENRVKYGFDYRNNFQEWKDTLNDMSLEEWQESKFIEWKSDNLSNNTGTSSFFTIKNMTFEEWLKGIEKGEIRDVAGNILKPNMIDLSEFNRLKSSDYTAKEWYEDNKSKTDVQSILKSALYGAISGGIFEGATQFAPEVISYTRTGTTLGMNAIMNAVRNQSAASGTPKNIFQIMAETNQIIKEQSKTGKMSDLVEQYIKSPSFQSEYDSFINNIEQSRNETESSNKLLKRIKSIKESLFGPEENISEVQFATMKVADNLARTSLKNRLIESLDATTYQSYQELLAKINRLFNSEESLRKIMEKSKNINEAIKDIVENLTDDAREEMSEELLEELFAIVSVIKNKQRSTEPLQEELSSRKTKVQESIESEQAKLASLNEMLSQQFKKIEEIQKQIDGKTSALNKKGKRNTKERKDNLQGEIERCQQSLKSEESNIKKTEDSIKEVEKNIESSKARIDELENIKKILLNPEFDISSLSTEQFNNFVSELDSESLNVYAKDIVSRLSEISDSKMSELIERLNPITLGVFETQIVERVRHITEQEVLNHIKDKNASKFTQNIYEIEVSTDNTTNATETVSSKPATETVSSKPTAETVVSETTTETVSENTVETEPSTNTRNNNSTETVIRETVKPENETSRTEAKKELVSQNAALGTVGLIQMGALTGGLKGNQTLNNVLETIQTDINSLQQRYDSTTINGEVNVETEVNVNEETNSNINVREELKSQIEQKTKLYNDLTQLMSKYGVDGSALLTTLKEKIVSGKYELEQQLLNTETNIKETITDSITESEAAIKEIMQQFDLTKVDQTTLNEARTTAMYKILEIANKNNISVDGILSKINIDEMLVKNDAKSELEIAANRLNGIVEETDDLTEEDFKYLKSKDAQGAEDYIVLMEAIKNIRNRRFNMEDAKAINDIYNRIKNKSPKFIRDDDMKCITYYIAELKLKMYKHNLLGTAKIKDGTKTIKVNLYGKDISSNLLINSLNEINKLLKETPSFMKETITEINLFDFDCNLNLFFAMKYEGSISKSFTSSASSDGSAISFWKPSLFDLNSKKDSLEYAQGVETLHHEIGHNIDNRLGKCEHSYEMWTFKNQLWNEAIERDGGRDYAPTEYAKKTLQEDFAESIAKYMKDPSYFAEKFPNRAKILQNIFKAYTKKIDCSYNKAVKRVNKQSLKEKLSYEKEIFECRKVLDKMVKKTDLNNTRPDVLKSIQEFLYSQASDIAQKHNMSIEEVLERINYYKIFPKTNITVPEIITIAPQGRNALDFDSDINGNTNNNVKTRNTTEGIKTIESLEQISDKAIRDNLKKAIEKNQESSKKFKEGKISGAIAALSWSEINKILKSSTNAEVTNDLCKIWSTNAINPFMSKFNYEQTIKIVNELKNGISIETLRELGIEGILDGNTTIETLYKNRAYDIIKEALGISKDEAFTNSKGSNVEIDIEFAKMIIKGNQQVIKYKEDSKYQNNFIKNLTKFSPEQFQEINNLFNLISQFEVCESAIDYNGKIEDFGRIILDAIYKINETGTQKINLNIEIIDGLLKLAPKLSSLSDCNSTISTLLSDYFYHDGDYIFINEKPHLNEKTGKEETKLRKYAEAILKSLGKTVDDVIRVDDNGNITIDETFATETVKNKLNNYETRILYNYLETNIKNRLVPKQKELDNSLYDLNKNIRKLNKEIEKLHEKIKNKANEIEELQQSLVTANNALAEAKDKKAQIIAEIRKNASNASSLRNELRVILQNAGFGINVLPKQGTNPLNTNYEGAVINKYISDNLTKNEIITLIKSLKRVTNEIESPEQKEAFRKKIEEVFNKVAKEGLEKNVESIKALVKEIVKYDSNLLPTMYQYLNEADFLISYEQMVFDGAFKSNDFVNIALGITSIEQSIFEEKIKSWEEKQDSFSSYTMLNRYNYYKFVKEVLDHGIVKTKIDWPKLGGYLGIPEQLMEFISKHFDVQEDIYISRHGDKKGTNVSLTLKSSVETVFGNLKDGSLARALPSRYGKDFMEGTINIKKYRTLCDCLYEYLSKENINDSTELTLINKLKENGIEVDTVNVKELIEAYQKAYNTSRTLQDFRIINKDFIKRFIKEGKTSEEFINLIKDASTEIQIEISDMISDYVTTKDERILDDVIETVKKDFIKRFIENDKTTIEDFNNLIKDASSEIKSEISDTINNYKATNDESILNNIVKKTGSFFEVRMNYDLKYGICGTIASFGDLPGGGSQATLMFSYGLLEKCGIIKDVRSGILTPKGSYLFPKELVENVSEENINSLKKAIYDLTEIGNNIIDISSKYEEIDGIIENIKNELKNSGKYTENIGKAIETFKEIMNFNKYIQTHKMTDIVKAIGKLSISEIDNLIENSSYIFELSESTKILNTIENLQEVIKEIPEARRTQVMGKILSKMTIENLQEVIDEMPEARRTQVMDAILVKMIKGEALNQETSDAIFKSKMFDGDSSFAKEYLHHIIEVGIPELGINGSQELANKISKVYEKARETTKEMSNLYSYCDHTEAHVLQVAFDTIEKAKQIATSKGQTLSETQIKNLFYAGLFHDLGMASGADSVLGIRLDTQKTTTKIKLIPKLIRKLIANEIRENHSLNSALQVLEMRTELVNLGLNADLIAMMCFSHSKSNSGVGNLASEGDWSYSVSKIRSALKAINGISGKNIRFILENIGGIETLETIQTNSKQKINKDAKGKKIKSKLKVPGIQRIIFEEGVLNDLEIMSLAIRMGDAYVTKANVKLEEPIKWVGTDGKTYSTDLLVLTQAGVYMAYDATQTAISTKYKQTDDTETSVESAFIYLRKTKDGKFVPWKDGYGVDAEGKYTNVKDSLMYLEPVKTKDGKILTEEGYYYKEDKTAGTRTYYYKEGNAYTEVETILKERYNEAEEKYGKTLLTSTGKFLVGESNVTYSVEVRGDTLVSIYKIGDIEIFQNNTRSKGIYERLGEIATSRNIKHEVDIRFEGEQFESNFMKVGDRYVGITPIAQEYIAAIKDYQSDYEGIVLKINGVNINNFETNTFD